MKYSFKSNKNSYYDALNDLINNEIKITAKNIVLENCENNSLGQSLSESKIVLGFWSSTLIESLYYNAIPCTINLHKNFKYYPTYNKHKIGLVENNIKAMQSKVMDLIKNEDKLDKIRKKTELKKNFFFRGDGQKSKDLISNFLSNIT